MIVLGDLNAKVGVGNSGVEYIVGRHDNGGRFVDFCSTHHLDIGGTTFQHRTCDKVSWQDPSGRYGNQIDHLAISRRFSGCLDDIRNRKGDDIGNHYLMVAMLRLRKAAIKQPNEMYRRPPIYFTLRLKSAALFNQNVEEHIHNFRSPSQPNLNWDAEKRGVSDRRGFGNW